MKIELYKSALCPRCIYTLKILKGLQQEYTNLEIITYDIVTDIKAFKESDIIMIPTIRIDNIKRSWLLPKKSQITEFILENR